MCLTLTFIKLDFFDFQIEILYNLEFNSQVPG